MSRKQNRLFQRVLQIAGVLDANYAPNLSDDVQMVYVMDDLSELLPQVRRPRCYDDISVIAGGAGNYAVVELVPPPDGAMMVLYCQNNDAGNDWVFGVQEGTLIQSGLFEESAGDHGWTTQRPTRSILATGYRTTIPDGWTMASGGGEISWEHRPIIVEHGDRAYFVCRTANVVSGPVRYYFQEIPQIPTTV